MQETQLLVKIYDERLNLDPRFCKYIIKFVHIKFEQFFLELNIEHHLLLKEMGRK